jgi:hypothetical protein
MAKGGSGTVVVETASWRGSSRMRDLIQVWRPGGAAPQRIAAFSAALLGGLLCHLVLLLRCRLLFPLGPLRPRAPCATAAA